MDWNIQKIKNIKEKETESNRHPQVYIKSLAPRVITAVVPLPGRDEPFCVMIVMQFTHSLQP